MFYSQQLLATKTPLGQIWMAATLQAKINRKQLDKLDIVKICQEILNPSVPMALRLSAILMSGVVIVYRKKVKLLLDDFSEHQEKFKEAIKEMKSSRSAVDHTVLPKGKAQAKYEAVTLPENVMEQPVLFKHTARFRGMCLEDLDEQYVNVNLDDDDFARTEHHHQSEAANITLDDNFEYGLYETDIFNRFERFDIADDETTTNITPDGHPEARSTRAPSPPRPEDPPQQQEQCAAPSPIREEPQQGDSLKEQEEQKTKGQQPTMLGKRKARDKCPQVEVIVDDQMYIPGDIYQSWLNDQSSLTSKRHLVRSKINPIKDFKIAYLLGLPLVGLLHCSDDSEEVPYPQQLMQKRMERSKVKPPKPSTSSGDKPSSSSQEPHCDRSVTPAIPGLSRRPASSSGGSGRGAFQPSEPEIQVQSGSGRLASSSGGSERGGFLTSSGSGRAKRRQLSPGQTSGNLDPVEEEFPMEQEGRGVKLRRLSDIGANPETEPTQTPFRKQSSPPTDHVITESIDSYLELHLESPGALPSESLSQLTYGMNTAQAARVFYQTCALATRDRIKVAQVKPYGPILISRGANV